MPVGAGASVSRPQHKAVAAYGANLAPYGAGGIKPSSSPYVKSSPNPLVKTYDASIASRTYDASNRNRRLHQTFRFPEGRATGDHLHQGASDLSRTQNGLQIRSTYDLKHTMTMSPVTAAIALAHEGMSSPESSANVFAQLQALDSAHKQ